MALTSPGSRFQQPARRSKPQFLDYIEVNGEKVELCPGMNAIIGENGAGKSSLLAMMTSPTLEKHVKGLKEQNKVEIPKLLDGDNVIKIKQNELEQRYWKNGGMFEESLYLPVDNAQFELKMHDWSSAVKNRVRFNLRQAATKNKLKETSFRFDFDLESKTYYIHVTEPNEFTRTNNPHEGHLQKINNALDILKAELETGYYESGTPEHQELTAAIAALDRLAQLLSEKSNNVKLVADTRNAISHAIAQYEETIRSKETDKDAEKRNYRGPKNAVRAVVLEAVSSACAEAPAVPLFRRCPVRQGQRSVPRRDSNSSLLLGMPMRLP